MVDYSIVGKRFGRLTVVGLDHFGKYHGTWWKCRCDCGKEKVVYRGGLTSGDTTSCGCYHREHLSEYGKTHGLTRHPLYSIWSGMVQRCTNPNAENYYRYGGRGIDIFEPWKKDFETFYNWAINNGYSTALSLDRINNNGNYEPCNCRWVTQKEQSNNTRRNHKVTYNDETHTIAEWSEMLGVNHETLRYRVLHDNMSDFKNYFTKTGEKKDV